MPAAIPVELWPHSPDWAVAAEEAAKRLHSVLGANVLVVHHIGSTSIPGICAKPIVDLMPVVSSVRWFDEQTALLLSLGFRSWGEYGIEGRRYCTLEDGATGKRKFQLHAFEVDHPAIERHLAFRDYLRAHPEVALAYDAEKRRCQALYPRDSHAYTDAKSGWIASQLEAAVAYWKSPK